MMPLKNIDSNNQRIPLGALPASISATLKPEKEALVTFTAVVLGLASPK